MTLSTPEDVKLVSESAAKTIGETSPSIIRDIIEVSEELGYMVHGVKLNANYARTLRKGIAPLTPEGETKGSSFWSTGLSIFGQPQPGGRVITYGSTFFHYAPSRDSKSEQSFHTLAIGKRDDLLNAGLNVRTRAVTQPQVFDTVPRSLIEIIRIAVSFHDSDIYTPRESAQIGERLLVQELDRSLRHGYRPGTLSKVKYKA